MSSLQSKRILYGYFFLGAMTLALYFFFGFLSAARFLGGIILYFIIIYSGYWIWKTVLSKDPINPIHFFILYIYKLSIFLSVFLLLGGIFTYYHNSIYPAYMPLYTLSNGEKTVQFQTMSHIARKKFYNDIQIDILKAKNTGAVLFFEGVQSGSSESKRIFDAALGVELSPELYENFSKLYGVTYQNNDDFLGIVNDQDFNIDLDMDTIVALYKEKEAEKFQEIEKQKAEANEDVYNELARFEEKTEKKEVLDINKEVLERLAQLDERQLIFVRYINSSLLNFMIKQETLRNFIIEKLDMESIMSVILDDRNAFLVKNIIDSEFDTIFVLYGLMHFDGVLEMLQESDPRWKIEDVSYSYPISSPVFPIGSIQ